MDLTTQCPQCGSVFSANLQQLQLRKGYVRCINCGSIFDGYEAVVPSSRAPGPVSGPALAPVPATASARASATVPAPGSIHAPAVPAPVSISVPNSTSTPASASASAVTATPPFPSVLRQRSHTAAGDPRAEPVVADITAPSFTISAGTTETTETARPYGARAEPVLPAVVRRPATRAARRGDIAFTPPPSGEDAAVYLDSDAADVMPRVYVEPRAQMRDDDPPQVPDFLDEAPARRHGFASFLWSVLALIATALLLAQMTYVYRVQLASQIPGLRPVLEQACEALKCAVPYPRRIQLISIMNSSLQAVAKADGADNDSNQMMLHVTLRNNYDRPQEWPTLTLDLVDLSGAVVVKKNLAPASYLSLSLLHSPFAAQSEVIATVPLNIKNVAVNGYQLGKFFP